MRVTRLVAGGAAFGAGALQVLEVFARGLWEAAGRSRVELLANLLGDGSVLFAAAAGAGLYLVVRGHLGSRERQVADLGGIVFGLAAFLALLAVVYDLFWILWGPVLYGQATVPAPSVISQVPFLAVWMGLLLAGAASVRASSLGGWRHLALGLALVSFPTPVVVAALTPLESGLGIRATGLPMLLPAGGWILAGFFLIGAKVPARAAGA